MRPIDNNNISQLLWDSFPVSQQPPIWEPPSHYSMVEPLPDIKVQEESPAAKHVDGLGVPCCALLVEHI